MGVSDGQPVDAATTNPAFLDANQDDTAFGIITLDNAQPASGPTIGNTQGAINNLLTGTGATETTPGTQYGSNTVVVDGESHETSIGKIDQRFNGATGHDHDGTAGNGPPISGAAVGGVPLIGSFYSNSDLIGVSGSSNNVSALMIGKTPSSGPTVLGVVVTAPNNKVPIYNANPNFENEQFKDANGSPVYGRLTEAAGVWTLSFFSLIGAVETAYSFASPQTVRWFYQELVQRLVNAPVYSEQLIQPDPKAVRSLKKTGGTALYGDVELEEGAGVVITTIGQKLNIAAGGAGTGPDEPVTLVNFAASPYAVTNTDRVLLVDASGGPVTINLFQILGLIGRRLRIMKTDASANAVTINAFAGDFINQVTSTTLPGRDDAITMITSTNVWRVFA